MTAVETIGLVKTYGAVRALDGLDLTVPEGSVVGLLGPNGAGKTTTIRILLGLARPTSGTARILGSDVVSAGDDVRARVGYLPDVPGFYPWMTAPEWMRFAASLFGLDAATTAARTDALLDMAGLTGVTQRIGGFSRGMKQRLGVAQALINAPRLLVLDEPTSALDPLGRRDVLELVAALRGRTTVLFSTHLLADAERICDTIAVIDRGRLVAHDTVDALRSRHGGSHVLAVDVTDDASALIETLRQEPWCVRCDPTTNGATVTTSDLATARERIPVLVAALGTGLVRFEEQEASLEDVFVDLVRADQ